jgi:hypothetical protein
MKVFRVAAVFFEVLTEGKNEVVNRAGSGIDIIAPYGL